MAQPSRHGGNIIHQIGIATCVPVDICVLRRTTTRRAVVHWYRGLLHLPRGSNVVDGAAFDVGTIQCWSLNLSSVTCTDGGGECPGADLALGMTASPEPVITGNNLTYTISVTNNGTVTSADLSGFSGLQLVTSGTGTITYSGTGNVTQTGAGTALNIQGDAGVVNITVGGLTCTVPSALSSKVTALKVNDRAEIKCSLVGGVNTLTRVETEH